ncbi:Liver carboxylesterase [Wickerhamomyces ciferrii]|uniref:Carboxylic ester hydrolase n=1 Tax=Wickerhamomyces ciferrii (strain ATCC 14091 / BCRC 22168 / CBS 111 / JCM 3599 / NBRC 0793 / NRRL Y-1031 F-60-10) TaxID=1206466 RepID=K0KCU3_WICCF|nr:Liver carboxylesterase [Wickerhamomyces ciferrii]CCH42915.1 Liver carboxylesterase [Wickerhamomyces ciferrii]
MLFLFALLTLVLSSPISNDQDVNTPIVQIQNGTISGKYITSFNQDAFLGLPFAEPPLGSLRFKPPQSYNHSWDSTRNFTEFGDACIASSGIYTFPKSEDCLNLNIVRPHGLGKDAKLPVGIWIHGGSFTEGSGRSPEFNLSWVIQNSIDIGKPIIGITINYRLNGFGFLKSDEIQRKGWTNIGLRDQIKAIEWIHENIAEFGGDPNHLVLWGESAGSVSIGKILSQSKYLDTNYIKGAIMQSGSNIVPLVKPADIKPSQDDFLSVVKYVDCFNNVSDYIECLQKVDSDKLRDAFKLANKIVKVGYKYPYLDGDVLPKSSYETLRNNDDDFMKIPILLGTTTDEGSTFINQSLSTKQQVKSYLLNNSPNINNETIDQLLNLYSPDNPETIVPQDPTYNNTPIVYPEGITGDEYKTLGMLYGDLIFIAGTRITSRIYSQHQIPVFKYRFNIPSHKTFSKPYVGVTHAQDLVYVFDNRLTNNESEEDNLTSFYPDPRAPDIANTISKAWISFIYNLDPNIQDSNKLKAELPNWTRYGDTKPGKNMVFDLKGNHLEDDVFRVEQIEFIESILSQLNA